MARTSPGYAAAEEPPRVRSRGHHPRKCRCQLLQTGCRAGRLDCTAQDLQSKRPLDILLTHSRRMCSSTTAREVVVMVAEAVGLGAAAKAAVGMAAAARVAASDRRSPSSRCLSRVTRYGSLFWRIVTFRDVAGVDQRQLQLYSLVIGSHCCSSSRVLVRLRLRRQWEFESS